MELSEVKSRLSVKLLKVVFSLYFLIAFLITSVQIYITFTDAKEQIQNDMVAIEESFKPALSTAIWELNEQQITTIVRGILEINYVTAISVIDEQGKMLIHEGEAAGVQGSNAFFHAFTIQKLSFGSSYKLADVRLYSSRQMVVDRIYVSVVALVINAAIKTIVLWFLLLWAFKKYIFSPLNELVWGLRTLDISRTEPQLISLNIEDENELKLIETSFNDMSAALKGQRDALIEQKQELLDVEKLQSKMLQTEVDRQTQDLIVAKDVAEKANASKTRFLAAASHDLRQPLQAIKLFCAALGQSLSKNGNDVSGSNREMVDYIDQSVNSLGELLNSLLDISKLDSGGIKPELQSFPVSEVLENCANTFASSAKEKGLDFRLVPCSATIISDPVLLQRIVDNFVSNAVNYTQNGKLLIGCRRTTDSLRIEVWDTGTGIFQDSLDEIFEEFHQLENPARRRDKGLGLGLSIAKRIADLLSHTLKVRSELDTGSVFSISLPYGLSPSSSRKSDVIDIDLPKGDAETQILIIEDDPIVLRATMLLISSWGYEVAGATSSAEAQSIIADRRSRPDLMIVDYQLPEDMTGLEIFNTIVHQHELDIPGIVISGATSPDMLEAISQSKLVHLTKPINASELNQHIRKLLF